MTVTESPYRVVADIINSTCGQSISAGGVWNIMQRLGERISEEEDYTVKQMNADQSEGTKERQCLQEWKKCSKSTEKRWKRKSICRYSEYAHADSRRSTDSIKKSI